MEGILKRLIFVFCGMVLVAAFYDPTIVWMGSWRKSPPVAVGKYHESKRQIVGPFSPVASGKQVKSANKGTASRGSTAIATADSNVVSPGATKKFLFSNPQSPSNPKPSSNPSMEESRDSVNIYPIPKRIDVGHIEGKGIGYNTGYTKLSIVFAPEYRVGHYLSLIDVRGVVFDDGKFAANAGYIGRYLPKSFCEVFGFNVFYDFRQGHRGNYNQVSGGFEVLNRRWELHANASVPVGTREHIKRIVYDNYIGPFREVCKREEAAKYFFDGSIGYYMVNGKNFQMYAAAGPYYLFGKFGGSAVGGRALLRPQFGDVASVELSVSHDHIFETIYQVNVVLTLPLYKLSSRLKNKKGSCGTNNRQIYQPIDRDIVLLERTCCNNNF